MKTITWDEAITLLSPHSYTLLSTLAPGGRANLMGVGWWTIVSWSPPQVALSIGRGQFSRECLDALPEFALCFPSQAQARGAWLCGTVSGRDGDKFAMAGFTPVPAKLVRPPLVEGSTVSFECKVVNRIESGDHVLYIGDVLEVHGTPESPLHLYSIHYNKLVAIDKDLHHVDSPDPE
jgi:flavin reductase (DIM6/NTAB) family NADH-FMN oxidoreductase RutF